MEPRPPAQELQERLSSLPSVDRLVALLTDATPHTLVVAAARSAIEEARNEILAGGDAPSVEEIVTRARALGERRDLSFLRPVINATGVLIHTNLGRAPLGADQLAAVADISGA